MTLTVRQALHGLGQPTSLDQIPDICAPQEAQVVALRQQLGLARRVELGIILGGATASLGAYILNEMGHTQAASGVTIAAIIIGAAYSAVRLYQEDSI